MFDIIWCCHNLPGDLLNLFRVFLVLIPSSSVKCFVTFRKNVTPSFRLHLHWRSRRFLRKVWDLLPLLQGIKVLKKKFRICVWMAVKTHDSLTHSFSHVLKGFRKLLYSRIYEFAYWLLRALSHVQIIKVLMCC